MARHIITLAALALLADLIYMAYLAFPVNSHPVMKTFGGTYPSLLHKDIHVDYSLNPSAEQFLVYVPADYDPAQPFGLIVYNSAGDKITTLPRGWKAVLDKRHYIFIAPQNVGNHQLGGRRYGAAVLAALKASEAYTIDHDRIYAAGVSGGARTANHLAYYQPDIFRGTIQSCGADFYKPVPIVHASSSMQTDTLGLPYGIFKADSVEVSGALTTRLTFITGDRDFRHGNVLDIFHGGYEKEGFQTRLFDVKGMGHEDVDGDTLDKALDFLETGK